MHTHNQETNKNPQPASAPGAGYAVPSGAAPTAELGPMAVNVHRLEQRAKNLEALCGEMLATLHCNRKLKTLRCDEDALLDALIARWQRDYSAA